MKEVKKLSKALESNMATYYDDVLFCSSRIFSPEATYISCCEILAAPADYSETK